jgi:predicted GNAT superfamily acetyltransferase
MYWTFDPLVSRNAHLNLNRLGARIDSYVPDYYGSDTGSELHSGLGTDRFIVKWRLKDPRVKKLAGRAGQAGQHVSYAEVPVVNVATPEDKALPTAKIVRIEIPGDIQAVKKAEPETAWRWRMVTRRAFMHYLDAGYEVNTIYRDATGRSFYVLARPARRRK